MLSPLESRMEIPKTKQIISNLTNDNNLSLTLKNVEPVRSGKDGKVNNFFV